MTIRSLAASFGISLMPVREALRRLVAEHVLIMLPNRSVALPVITRERFREITRIRVSLEGLAAEEAAPIVPESDIERMEEHNAAMEDPRIIQSPQYLKHNREFHFTLYRGSRLPMLVSMVESLWLQIGPLLTFQQRAFTAEPPATQAHHRKALRALRKRDAAGVRDAVAADILDAARIISAGLP
jgi:DNA-binding GntR family transcriptional regulator